MKKTKTMTLCAMALMTAVSCSETETGIELEPGGDGGQVALGVAANLKVDAGTKAATKSVVSGSTLSYPKADFSTNAPGLGILVTNSNSTGWYSPDAANGGYTGHHVWYMGDENGAKWISINEKGETYAATTETPYYLTATVGKVYAYYPYDTDVTTNPSTISSEADLKIPVGITASGSIDASTNNAKKYWNTSSKNWSPRLTANKVNQSDAAEKDYLYFAGSDGRNVNNGRAEGQTPFDPEGGPTNNDADNPGYQINLDMNHALAMVSFRVYDGGQLSSNAVNFTKFVIKNHDGGTNLFKTGTGKMWLKDGTISDNSTTGTLTRTVSNYILMRQINDAAAQGEYAFVENGSQVNGQAVSRTVSAIVYPTVFGENEIDVVVTLQEGGNEAVEYTVTLPGYEWTAGSNCIYTFSAGRNKLTVMDVSVQEWSDDEQADIPL